MKTVVVAGDLICDHNLVCEMSARPYHHALPRQTIPNMTAGGAWFLKRVIDRVVDKKTVSVQGIPLGRSKSKLKHESVCNAFQVWTPHGPADGKRSGEAVWRISQFLGCHRPESVSKNPLVPDGNEPRPDVLAIDDLCLRFQEWKKLWPAALLDVGDPGAVVIKTSSADFDAPVWKTLLAPGWAERVTVVISAEALRERGAAITKGLSWERTLEETAAELSEGVSSYYLGRCRRVVVHYGASGAASFTRCPLRFAVSESSGGTGPLAGAEMLADELQFERFLYDPEYNEGVRERRSSGRMFGALTILTAAVVRYELEPETYPIYLALGRALAAMRANYRVGAGDDPRHFDADAAESSIGAILAWSGKTKSLKNEPASAFCTAYPRYTDDFPYGLPPHVRGEGTRSNLLRDIIGEGEDYAVAKGIEIVMRGADKALWAAPKARYKKYVTVDREEVERINAIHNLLLSYRESPDDGNPLSIAVFGPPGSGKSFAIKQLLKTVFPRRDPLVFNLSEFRGPDDLTEAFHQVRDITIQGLVPIVFWDEFDADNLKWLKHFLAPMNDAEFRAGSLVHPLGRAVFVFAGGTADCFEDFGEDLRKREAEKDKKQRRKDDDSPNQYKALKVPDFISRLRGFVNVKGPNPQNAPAGETAAAIGCAGEAVPRYEHIIRRAMLLRSALERYRSDVIDKSTGIAAISPDVVNGFLRVEEYKHGARSLMSVVSMSRLNRDRTFDQACLPPEELLKMHVTDDFMREVRKGQVDTDVTEPLAIECHKAWSTQREHDGWTPGDERDDDAHIHPRLMDYDKLKEDWKEDNRKTARLVQAKLMEVGLKIVRHGGTEDAETVSTRFIDAYMDELSEIEHVVWLRDRLVQGWEYAPKTDVKLRLHPDIATLEAIDEAAERAKEEAAEKGDKEAEKPKSSDRQLDEAIVGSIPGALASKGYVVAPVDDEPEQAK